MNAVLLNFLFIKEFFDNNRREKHILKYIQMKKAVI